MPTQQPYYVSSQPFRISGLSRPGAPGSTFGFRISPDLSGHITRNETPSDRTHAAGVPPMINLGLSAEDAPHPKNTKRTQLPRTAGVSPASPSPNLQNKPNLGCWRAQLCETNPIFVETPNLHSTIYNPLAQLPPDPRPKCVARPYCFFGFAALSFALPFPLLLSWVFG